MGQSSEPEVQRKDAWDKAAILFGAASKILLPIAVLLVGELLSSGLKQREVIIQEREFSREWVQIALNVLSDAELSDQKEMRAWAVSVINFYVEDDRVRLRGSLADELIGGSTSLPAATSERWQLRDQRASLFMELLRSQGRVRATTDSRGGLRIRSGPGTEFEPIGLLKAGDELAVLEVRNNWARVSFDAQNGVVEGWAHVFFLQPMASEQP